MKRILPLLLCLFLLAGCSSAPVADDPNTMDVVNSIDRDVRTYGLTDADYTVENLRQYKPGF